MRRLARYTLNGLTVLSLLLCLATLLASVLFPLLYPMGMSQDLIDETNRIEMHFHGSKIAVRRLVPFDPVDLPYVNSAFHASPLVSCNYWLVAVLTSLLPACRAALWSAGWLRATRLAARIGRCIRCGYSLTGNVSGVCPECGAKVRTA